MSAAEKLKTVQALCTHHAKNNGPKRLQTSLGVGELRQLVGARLEGGVVSYPHLWDDNGTWRTTGFELVPK